MRITSVAALAAGALALISVSALAGTIGSHLLGRPAAPSSEVAASGSNIFGELIDPQTGSTSFEVTDVSLATNSSLTIEIGRKLVVGATSLEWPSDNYDNWGGVLGGQEPSKEVLGNSWDLNIPYMEATHDARTGWVSYAPGGPTTNRCSTVFGPPTSMGLWPFYSTPYEPKTFHGGVSINIPGKDTGNLLKIDPGAQVPSNGLTYRGATNSGSRISCLTSIKNGQGEGFLVLLPDGTKYWFDWMATKRKPSIMSGGSLGTWSISDSYSSSNEISPQVIVPLVRAFLFVTKVEDRFGNSLTYSYDPANPFRLNSITSNDGVSVSLSYNSGGQLQYVVAGSKRWTYEYQTGELRRVVLPDNTAWEYIDTSKLGMLFGDREQDVMLMQKDCVVNVSNMKSSSTPEAQDDVSITMKAPSGAQGVFRFREIVHGSSRAPGSCTVKRVDYSTGPGSSAYYFLTVIDGAPLLNRVASLYAREISGPALPLQKWTYRYYPAWSYLSACPSGSSCATTTTTEVTEPDGSLTKYVYGNDYQVNSGVLLQTSTSLAGVVARISTQQKLAAATGQCFPDSNGLDSSPLGNPLHSKNRPLLTSTVSQDGAAFTSRVDSFDCLARPLQVTRFSSGMASNFSKVEKSEYSDNLASWVMGQVKKTIVDNVVVNEVFHDPISALPLWEKAFGTLQSTIAYNPNGSIASVKDGKNQATAFSNYKRGVPQHILLPDARTRTSVIDDDGQAKSTTDQLGTTTSYSYDAMGRLSGVTYPIGDAVAWSNTTVSFVPIASAEYGIPAGHWRQIAQTGGGRTTTYYDALWQPVLVVSEDVSNALTKSFVVKRYDANRRLTFTGYPVSNLVSIGDALKGTTTKYDALGRVTQTLQDSELGVLTTTAEYLSGFKTKVTNPRGYATTTSYQVFDSPGTDSPVRIEAPEGALTTITRDAFGKPLNITRSGAGN